MLTLSGQWTFKPQVLVTHESQVHEINHFNNYIKAILEYKNTTQLKQGTLWQRQKLIMTHNFTEQKVEVECPLPPITNNF